MDKNTNLRAIVDVHDNCVSILGLYDNYNAAYQAYAGFANYYDRKQDHKIFMSDYDVNVGISEAALEYFKYDERIFDLPYWEAVVSSNPNGYEIIRCDIVPPAEIARKASSKGVSIHTECEVIKPGFYLLSWFRAGNEASAKLAAVKTVEDYIFQKNGDITRDLIRFESYVADHIYVANAMDMVEKLNRYSNVGYMVDEKYLVEWRSPILCTEVELSEDPDGGYRMRILRFPSSVKLLDDKGDVIAFLDLTKKEG